MPVAMPVLMYGGRATSVKQGRLCAMLTRSPRGTNRLEGKGAQNTCRCWPPPCELMSVTRHIHCPKYCASRLAMASLPAMVAHDAKQWGGRGPTLSSRRFSKKQTLLCIETNGTQHQHQRQYLTMHVGGAFVTSIIAVLRRLLGQYNYVLKGRRCRRTAN